MKKTLSYNKVRKYGLISSIIVFITNITRVLFTGVIPEDIIVALLLIGIIPYSGISIFSIFVIKKHKLDTDEMSTANDLKATNFTYLALSFLFITVLTVTFFTTIEIVVSFSLVFSIYMLMQIIKDSYYLYLEREVNSDARAEDED